jgi:hypothetical protein
MAAFAAIFLGVVLLLINTIFIGRIVKKNKRPETNLAKQK